MHPPESETTRIARAVAAALDSAAASERVGGVPGFTTIPSKPTPLLNDVLWAVVTGYCAGYTLKKTGRVAMIGFGLIFIATQIARASKTLPESIFETTETAVAGTAVATTPNDDDVDLIINTNSAAATPTTTPSLRGILDLRSWMTTAMLPFDMDGDGVVSINDAKLVVKKLVNALGDGILSRAVFTAALAAGVRQG